MSEVGIATENKTSIIRPSAVRQIAPSSALEAIHPLKETNAEQERFTIPIVDTRETPFQDQTEALQKRLKEDKIDIALRQARKFLGKYARQEPQDLAVKIIPGEHLGGQVTDKLIEIEMPTPQKLEERRTRPHPIFGVLPEAQYYTLVMAIASSATLHEGFHCLIDSKQDSQFAADLEKISGIPNEDGQVAALFDEGLAHAFQGLDAPYIETIGSLAPHINDTDSFVLKTRKSLGDKLRPLLKEYIAQGKTLDDAFLKQTVNMLKQFDLQKYIDECRVNPKQ